jgi:DnaJ domain
VNTHTPNPPLGSLFDTIRVKRRRRFEPENTQRCCDAPGCAKPGLYPAPKGRSAEGEFWHFCLEHVQAYNARYDYFAGMPEAAVQAFQRDSLTGHRQTKPMASSGTSVPAEEAKIGVAHTTFRRAQRMKATVVRERAYPAVVMKAFSDLHLEPTADSDAIRVQYKTMVKRFHPDAHGGDRGYEERLRAIIAAHKVLKAAGLC